MDSIKASPFVLELMRLNDEQIRATDPEAKQGWTDEIAHLLRMNATGRLDEYFASRHERT